MRTYGRITNADGSKTWKVVTTDANGFNDDVWLTTLCQVLLLNLNESPFYANYGLPDQQALVQQVAPDFYVTRTQQLFARYFASLIVARDTAAVEPTYNISVITNQGAKQIVSVPI
jgi:hypothetical protein